jgi:hypothetical protein
VAVDRWARAGEPPPAAGSAAQAGAPADDAEEE